MSATLSTAERLKFELLSTGAAPTARATAAINHVVDGGPWSPDDYASTRGVILRLDGHVWVNVSMLAPDSSDDAAYMLDHDSDGFVVRAPGVEVRAEFWPPAKYHFEAGKNGRPFWNYVVTHGDRARLSPTIGCAMVCDFCNIPFDDTYAGVKPLDPLLEAAIVALQDERQPAHHFLISGGTPGPAHVDALKHVYESVLTTFPGIDVDIMMVPLPGLFDLPRLDELGVNEFSVNLEIFDEDIAKSVMRHKHRQGRQYYLDFLADAAETLGPGRVRSMLMVGLEPEESTLAGVRAILERGCVPVLSSFTPDPVTPMAQVPAPTAELSLSVFLRARDMAAEFGSPLGPGCPPCTHNTLALADRDESGVRYSHEVPELVARV